MWHENPTWGAPRIHGELLMLGVDIGETSVSKYMPRHRNSPSQTWRTFLENHVQDFVSIDFFTVPTIRFQILYVFVVLAHHRRRIVHFAVTAHPTAEWTAYQILQAFPWDSAPRYLLRDRDRIFGSVFVHQLEVMDIEQVLSAPAAPWQRAYVERVIGTIRRECLDHVIVLNQHSLSRHLRRFLEYYHRSRCHLSLLKDAPDTRPTRTGARRERSTSRRPSPSVRTTRCLTIASFLLLLHWRSEPLSAGYPMLNVPTLITSGTNFEPRR